MERTVSGIDVAMADAKRNGRMAKAPSPREFDTNPRSRRTNRSLRAAADFAAFADDLRRDLNPRGPLERLMADHVVQSAWRLRTTLDRQAARPASSDDQAAPKRPAPSAADRAARSVRDAIVSLDFIRGRTPARPSRPDIHDGIEPNEWPIVPDPSILILPMEVVPEPEDDDRPEAWRDRLVFDYEVSDNSPIVRGTWITVGHVVSEIVDGSSWADILRTHPELSEEDIRACLAYTVAEES